MNIPIAKTNLTETEVNAVLEPLRSGCLVQGPKVREFEEKWSDFTGAKHSIAVTSCTSGLHLSLAALGFGQDDEAIVPAFTWISTANVIEHQGGKVVFCDIDLNTFNLDPVQSSRRSQIAPRRFFLFIYLVFLRKWIQFSSLQINTGFLFLKMRPVDLAQSTSTNMSGLLGMPVALVSTPERRLQQEKVA